MCMLGVAKLLEQSESDRSASHARVFVLVDALCSTTDALLWFEDSTDALRRRKILILICANRSSKSPSPSFR